MKISSKTIKILQNFSNINEGIVIHPGNVLRTMNGNERSVFAEAVVDELFEKEFGIYDLKRFLAILSMTKEPDIEVDDVVVKIRGGKSTVNVRHTNTKLIKSPPNDRSINAEYLATFDMGELDIKWLFDTSSILGTPHIIFVAKDGMIKVQCADVEGKLVDEGSLELCNSETAFKAVLSVEKLKIMPGAYEVSVSSKGVVQFAAKNIKLKYWIAILKEPSEF